MDRKQLRRRLVRRPNAVRTHGSHFLFQYGTEVPIVVPYRRPHVLAAYVRDVLRRTKETDDDE